MSDTCPFVITKGNRKGQVCGDKTKPGIKYCRMHSRNLGVKQELGVLSASMSDQTSIPRNINPDYVAKVPRNLLPKIKKDENAKKSAFIDAFNKNLDTKLDSSVSELDMNEIYDEFDVADNVDAEIEDDVNENIDNDKVRALEKELQFEREQNLKAQRRINCMFTMKQCLFTGVKAVSDIAEHIGGDNLNGYSDTVMNSEEINALLDEMSDDFEVLVGFSEMPCSVRLLLTMGILGSAVYTKNVTGLAIKKPNSRNMASNSNNNNPNDNNSNDNNSTNNNPNNNNHNSNNHQQQSEKVKHSFSPAYVNK